MNRAATLLKSDIRNILRDPILVWVSFVPFLLIGILRFGLPALTNAIAEDFDLIPYHPLIFSFFLQLTPYMYGLVIGLMLLDERDEHLLTAISVTPLSKGGFLLYRLGMPVGLSFLAAYAFLHLAGVIALSIVPFTLIALLVALQAPINTMLLVAFARNKVEGMAVAKAGGVLLMAPIAIPFLDPPLQYIAGIAPTYWVSKAVIAAEEGSGALWWILPVGALVTIVLNGLLRARFYKQAG